VNIKMITERKSTAIRASACGRPTTAMTSPITTQGSTRSREAGNPHSAVVTANATTYSAKNTMRRRRQRRAGASASSMTAAGSEPAIAHWYHAGCVGPGPETSALLLADSSSRSHLEARRVAGCRG
jgi:hypothetical protein